MIERQVVARISALQPSQRSPDPEQWAELCRLVAVLARFEQYFRAGPRILPYLAGPITEHGHNLDDLACSLINEPSMRDLDMLGRITIEDHASVREASDLHIGPTFAQSSALGGADADLVYDGALLDMKSTSQARIVGREEVWQLIGYVLADTDDTYSITRVGFAALRRRRSIFWLAEDLIRELAGGQARPVTHLRGEFAGLLAQQRVSTEGKARRTAARQRARPRGVDPPPT